MYLSKSIYICKYESMHLCIVCVYVYKNVSKILTFLVIYYSACIKEIQKWPLYEVKEDILLFVLNTKLPLSDIWLLSYKQNSFGFFLKKFKLWIFSKKNKIIFLISQQPNIVKTLFCIQNKWQDNLKTIVVAFLQAE